MAKRTHVDLRKDGEMKTVRVYQDGMDPATEYELAIDLRGRAYVLEDSFLVSLVDGLLAQIDELHKVRRLIVAPRRKPLIVPGRNGGKGKKEG